MALMPKRVKHRKSQRGRIRGDAFRGNRVVHGDFGLQAMQGGWISAQTLESPTVSARRLQTIRLSKPTPTPTPSPSPVASPSAS